jgi:hypothetical protein
MSLQPEFDLKEYRTLSRKLLLLVCVCMMSVSAFGAAAQEETVDLSGIKTYLTETIAELNANAETLQTASDDYYALAEAANFDYEALSENADAKAALVAAKDAWMTASPLYEQVEGIVAGVPSLSEFDVILDAGTSAEEDPEGAVPFDLTLPDGTVMPKPGNLFGLLESTLWNTRAEFSSGVDIDLNDNGEVEFGEGLPDANMLKGTADTFADYVAQLVEAADAWEPTETDAFTALVVMTPTMSEYFESWKNSRFVLGEESTQSDFVVISRLADVVDILSGLEVVYSNVSPLVEEVNPEQSAQIAEAYTDLRAYVDELHAQELEGKQFTPEEADFFGSEAQDRAQAITGQVAQAAALLEIELPEE